MCKNKKNCECNCESKQIKLSLTESKALRVLVSKEPSYLLPTFRIIERLAPKTSKSKLIKESVKKLKYSKLPLKERVYKVYDLLEVTKKLLAEAGGSAEHKVKLPFTTIKNPTIEVVDDAGSPDTIILTWDLPLYAQAGDFMGIKEELSRIDKKVSKLRRNLPNELIFATGKYNDVFAQSGYIYDSVTRTNVVKGKYEDLVISKCEFYIPIKQDGQPKSFEQLLPHGEKLLKEIDLYLQGYFKEESVPYDKSIPKEPKAEKKDKLEDRWKTIKSKYTFDDVKEIADVYFENVSSDTFRNWDTLFGFLVQNREVRNFIQFVEESEMAMVEESVTLQEGVGEKSLMTKIREFATRFDIKMSNQTLEEFKEAILDDFEEDFGEVTIEDLAQIWDASGFEELEEGVRPGMNESTKSKKKELKEEILSIYDYRGLEGLLDRVEETKILEAFGPKIAKLFLAAVEFRNFIGEEYGNLEEGTHAGMNKIIKGRTGTLKEDDSSEYSEFVINYAPDDIDDNPYVSEIREELESIGVSFEETEEDDEVYFTFTASQEEFETVKSFLYYFSKGDAGNEGYIHLRDADGEDISLN